MSSRVCWYEQSGMFVAHVILVSAQVLLDFGTSDSGLTILSSIQFKALLYFTLLSMLSMLYFCVFLHGWLAGWVRFERAFNLSN